MKTNFFKVTALVLGTALVASCSLEPYEESDVETYTKDFIKEFGLISKDQTWNVATQVTANIELDESLDADSVFVYTAVPGGSNCYIVAAYPASTTSFTFDYLSGQEDAYVVVKNSSSNVVLGNYYDIVDGVMTVSSATRATRATEDCPVTKGTKVENLGTFNDNDLYFKNILNYGDYGQYSIKRTDIFNMYHLNNIVTEDAEKWKMSDWYSIIGTGGVFAEGIDETTYICNLLKWEDKLEPSKGVKYTLSSNGPVEISYVFGGTQRTDKLGYLYYTDDMSEDEILQTNRYILIEDGRVTSNIKSDGSYVTDWNTLSFTYVNDYKTNGTDHEITGKNYKLVYYGKDGNESPTYIFPEGTHIVFFYIMFENPTYADPTLTDFQNGTLRYSLPSLNKKFYYTMKEEIEKHGESSSSEESKAAESFVTYKWGNKTIMGLEDTSDDDMNDMLFFVNGNFKEVIPDIGPDSDPEPQSWIIACEDLGSTGDFDFNDIVFSVSHVSGKKTATLTPLAAGGIYPATITNTRNDVSFDDQETEIHGMLKATTSEMINTTTITNEGSPITIIVPSDFSMSYNGNADSADNMGGFFVKVKKGGVTTTEVEAPGQGSVPQMICVPGTWLWPTEKTKISEAYKDFGEYGAGYTSGSTWYETYEDGTVVVR